MNHGMVNGLMPLAVAAMSGSLQVVEMLSALGAQPGDHDAELLALQRGYTERSWSDSEP